MYPVNVQLHHIILKAIQDKGWETYSMNTHGKNFIYCLSVDTGEYHRIYQLDKNVKKKKRSISLVHCCSYFNNSKNGLLFCQ